MSRFFSSRNAAVEPYTPGEQPRDMQYIKLNTNESPYPPCPKAAAMAAEAAARLQLYSDPQCRDLNAAAAAHFAVGTDELLFTNGSDEILNYAVRAFCGPERGMVCPDITYSFYPVLAAVHRIRYTEIPLTKDFRIRLEDYRGVKGMVLLANPNAPTGIALSRAALEDFIAEDPERLVLVDEAYVDFGGESCLPLIRQYDNLIVTQTFSKSRSMAGARLGVGFAAKELIADMNAIKYSSNPYNVNSMTMAAGIGALLDGEYTRSCIAKIVDTREVFVEKLREMGYDVLPSSTNFVFAKSPRLGGQELYRKLRERGILVRHFETPRLRDYNRITIGTPGQMDALLAALRILEKTEEGK